MKKHPFEEAVLETSSSIHTVVLISSHIVHFSWANFAYLHVVPKKDVSGF